MATRKIPTPAAAGPFNQKDFIDYVSETYHKSRQVAAELWRITLEFGKKAEPCDGGLFWCHAVGGAGRSAFVTVHDNSQENSSRKIVKTVASTPAVGYASRSTKKFPATAPTRRSAIMPRTIRAAQAQVEEPEVEETEAEDTEAKDYSPYATKNITASMQDFADWIEAEVLEPVDLTLAEVGKKDPVRLIALAGTLRMEFQRSEFNQERRAQRAAERAAAAAAAAEAEAEETEEAEAEQPAKPATRARTTKGSAAKPASTEKATTAKSTAKPASRRRGTPAAAGTAAPY